MGSWGCQFSTGDQNPQIRYVFFQSSFQQCPRCEGKSIRKKSHSAGCRMNGDGYGTDVFTCLVCSWTTSFQYDEDGDTYYYETSGWKRGQQASKPDVQCTRTLKKPETTAASEGASTMIQSDVTKELLCLITDTGDCKQVRQLVEKHGNGGKMNVNATVEVELVKLSNNQVLEVAQQSLVEVAAQLEFWDIVDELVQFGADVSKSPFLMVYVAMQKQPVSLSIVETLVKKGAQINVVDKMGASPLWWACLRNRPELYRILLANKADPDGRPAAEADAFKQKAMCPLRLASFKGNMTLAQLLLEHRASVDGNPNDEVTPLCAAVQQKHFKVAKMLLEHGASVKAQPPARFENLTLLTIALDNKDTKMVELLLEKGADPNEREAGGSGRCPFTMAAESNDYAMMDKWISKGANVNHVGRDGRPLLFRAVERQDDKMIEFLLERKVNVNVQSENDNRTVLHLLVKLCDGRDKETRLTMLNSVLKLGADVNAQSKAGQTPIVATDQLDVLKILVDHGANVNHADENGRTPAMFMVGNLAALQYMVACGADVKVRAKDGMSILHLVNGSEEVSRPIIEFLLSHGVDINAQAENGITPLLDAVKRKRHGVVVNLVELGANVNLADKQGYTAFLAACSHSRTAIAELLKSKGADIHAKALNGDTAFSIASDHENVEMMKFLLGLGIDVNICDSKGRNALHWAAETDKFALVNQVMKTIHSVNVQNEKGNTALHIVCSHSSSKETIAILCRLCTAPGANVNVQNIIGETPLHLAVAQEDSLLLVQMLVELFHADTSLEDENGRTSVDLAYRGRWGRVDKELVQVLDPDGKHLTNKSPRVFLPRIPFQDLEWQRLREQMHDDCSICMEKLCAVPPEQQLHANGRPVLLECPGRHAFHTACIEVWRSKGTMKCPQCRSEFQRVSVPTKDQLQSVMEGESTMETVVVQKMERVNVGSSNVEEPVASTDESRKGKGEIMF